MRYLPIFLLAMALTALGPTFAFSYSRDFHSYPRGYSGCVCLFGYGSDGCTEVVSCSSEGGSCTKSCKLSADNFTPRR